MSKYSEFAGRFSPIIEETICAFLKEQTVSDELYEAMVYSVKAGGKKFRPLLFLATLELLDVELTKEEYKVASSLEMIHTYSLIHDDLPAMDDDDLRRGLPTNHKQFGEALAILAGDGLLTESFHILATAVIDADKKVQLINLLATQSGSSGMIAGQVEDIKAEHQQVSLDVLQKIHEKKTGALIKASVEMACVLKDINDIVFNFLMDYATSLGIAFQIRDDLLDVIGDERLIGKRVGSDERLEKSTYVSLLGLGKAKEAFYQQCEQAESALKQVKEELKLGNTQTLLDEILRELKEIK
ncbi:polyprenyl synthetase family protein [Vagococcus sp. JNUCC 83]